MLFRISLLVFVVFVGTLTAQECEETCATKCLEECPESRICTADEIDCGQGLPIPPDFCDPVRICVSNKCQCKIHISFIFKFSSFTLSIIFPFNISKLMTV